MYGLQGKLCSRELGKPKSVGWKLMDSNPPCWVCLKAHRVAASCTFQESIQFVTNHMKGIYIYKYLYTVMYRKVAKLQ